MVIAITLSIVSVTAIVIITVVRAASKFARGLLNVCKEVKAKRGAAPRG